MDCSDVIAFSRQNNWTSKRHYKALDVTVNQSLIPSMSMFKQFDFKVIAFVDSQALLKSYQEQMKQLT